jgi:hypothetical protein
MAGVLIFSLDYIKGFFFFFLQMLMNVQLEMGTFAEMANASTLWGLSSASAMKAMRWLQMGGPVWVSAGLTETRGKLLDTFAESGRLHSNPFWKPGGNSEWRHINLACKDFTF